MEVGPFRTIPAEKTESGQVELRLVEGGWEEFATVVFGEYMLSFGFFLVCSSFPWSLPAKFASGRFSSL